MKLLFPIIILFSMGWATEVQKVFEEKTQLDPCPNSPNCVSTQETRKRKRMKPIEFKGDLFHAKLRLKLLMREEKLKPTGVLVEEKGNYLRYEVTTKIGKFIDDVEFIFDEKNKLIHFRSASRKGYGDFGKNRRRMKHFKKNF